MNVKECLKAFNEAAVEHHTAMQKNHEKLADHHSKASGADGHRVLVDANEAMAKSHAMMAEHHSSMLKAVVDEMAKAAGDRLIPDGVSGILRGFPPTAIPRVGGPQLNKAAENIAPELRDIYAIDDIE
jgi:hypothetical protein